MRQSLIAQAYKLELRAEPARGERVIPLDATTGYGETVVSASQPSENSPLASSKPGWQVKVMIPRLLSQV